MLGCPLSKERGRLVMRFKRLEMKSIFARDVYIVDGTRTPFLKARGRPGHFSASDLAVSAGKSLLSRQKFMPQDLDEVIIGCMMPSADEANIGRVIALRLGCGKKVPGWTVQRNCASGLQSIDSAAQLIASGRANLILAGGTEAMSRAPLLLNSKMINFLADFKNSKSLINKIKLLTQFRPGYLKPIISLLRGLTDPIAGLNMGQTAEIISHRFKITREQMDVFSANSHARLAYAFDHQLMTEVSAIYDTQGKYYLEDDGLRRDTTVEKLSKLKPIFDQPYGLVTAGNSSQITDGAALVILASQEAVEKYKLPIMGKIIDVQWAGLEPSQMGLGPVHSISPILQRQNLSFDQIDAIEINEAFAGQVLACLAAFQDKQYCHEELGLDKPIGELDQHKLNINGGAIASGHPIGASGTRVLLHTLEILKHKKKKLGLASLCIGGGLGGAMLVESLSL